MARKVVKRPPLPPPPEPDLGPCCICERMWHVRTVLTITARAPTPGYGWGCPVCSLPPDGAIAVVCDECLDDLRRGRAQVEYVCDGPPSEGKRVSLLDISEKFDHDQLKHGVVRWDGS